MVDSDLLSRGHDKVGGVGLVLINIEFSHG